MSEPVHRTLGLTDDEFHKIIEILEAIKSS